MSMADDPKEPRQPSSDEQYRKLLKGEITSKQFVKDLKKEVRSRSTARRNDDRRRAASA
jgi:hypothetical protein